MGAGAPAPGDASRPAPTGEVLLAADGLGIAWFGTPATEALTALEAVLGPPDSDTGLVDPAEEQVLGACPQGRQRAVQWGHLTVGFLEGTSTYSPQPTEHFVMYSYGDPERVEPPVPLSTAEGVSLGTAVEDVRQAYGDSAQVVPGDELVEAHVRVEQGAPHPLVMQSIEERVSWIRAGEPCA